MAEGHHPMACGRSREIADRFPGETHDDEDRHVGNEEVGRYRKDLASLTNSAEVAKRQDQDEGNRHRNGVVPERGSRRNDRIGTGRH